MIQDSSLIIDDLCFFSFFQTFPPLSFLSHGSLREALIAVTFSGIFSSTQNAPVDLGNLAHNLLTALTISFLAHQWSRLPEKILALLPLGYFLGS